MSVDLYRRQALEKRINVSQVEYLRVAEANAFARRLAELKVPEYASFVAKLRHYQLQLPTKSDSERRRDNLVRLALLGELPDFESENGLASGIEADEILAIATSLKQLPANESTALRNSLSSLLGSQAEPSSLEKLRLVGLICQIEGDALSDAESLEELASRLCDLNAAELSGWRAVFEPLSDGLVPRFEQIIDDPAAGQLRRINAASLWVSYQPENVQAIIDKGLQAHSADYAPYVEHWNNNPNQAIEHLSGYLRRIPTDDATAETFARTAIGLANLGELGALRQCFSGAFGEAVRTRAITLCQPRMIPLEMLASEILLSDSAMERASIIAALGTYPVDKLRKEINQSLIELLQREFRTNPSSSVHGACESTLVRWNVPLPTLDASPPPRDALRWYRSPSGIDFVTLDIPAQVPTQVPDSPAADVPARPGYRVAVGSKEVTVAQFLEFLTDESNQVVMEHFLYKLEVSPDGDCPQNSVNWYVGAMFCNWLSRKEGIATDQLCFETDSVEVGLHQLKENAEMLSGYRFPSVAEAKFFCGGINPPFDQPRPAEVSVMSNFPWGNDARLLNEFAYTAENAMGRTWSAGHRLPNDIGMHNTLGSLLEWTITLDDKHSLPVCTGGNYINALPELFYIKPNSVAGFNFSNFYFGFRVARTLAMHE